MQQTYSLCYSSKFRRVWNCEEHYESVLDIEHRCEELKFEDRNVVTTFFPFNNLMPIFIQRMIIRKEILTKLRDTSDSILTNRIYF